MRDSQRQKVYDSEFKVRPSVECVNSHLEVQEFVNRVLENNKVQALYGKQLGIREIHVKVRRGKSFATGGYYNINIPETKWAWNKLVILHELAHVIVCRTQYRGRIASHGREFCEVFLNLTKIILGSVTHDELKEQYKNNKVKFKPQVKREFSPEHREALRVRMAEVRAARNEQ